MKPDARARLESALARIPDDVRRKHVRAARIVELPANVPPWSASGIRLQDGEAFTLYAEGRVVLSEEAGLWNGPRLHLWARVGERGPLLNGTQDTTTLRAPHEGALELCVYQGEWVTLDGALANADAYGVLQGGITALAVVWAGDAREGAGALASAVPDEPLFAAERDRLGHPVEKPAGWDYLWFLGPADIFERRSPDGIDGRPAICAHTRDDVGILQTPVDLPLTPDTVVRWRWRMHDLPSPVAENALPTHDYLSLALEFDDGQDLTWYWSSALPAGTHYRCPLPSWDRRETHWVVRSGADGLGEWHAEERNVYRDYADAIGSPPARIVAVWLIAVSVFQKREGRGDFAAIELEGDRRVQVL